MDTLLLILIISVLGPIAGSLIGVLKKPSEKFMHALMAFAAGTMLAISFLELIPQSISLSPLWLVVLGFVIGVVIMYFLDRIIPHVHPELNRPEQGMKIKRTAIYLLVGMFFHNFPEGMAIAIGAFSSTSSAFVISLAIAIHNIPEGITTSSPYFYATKRRLKAFLLSSSTAIPILIGFFVAKYLFEVIPLSFVGMVASATAGIMIYISADELIPTSCNKCGDCWSHRNIFALIGGILLVMVLGFI